MTFRTTGADPKFTSNSTFIGSEEFIRKYPEITQRVVKTVLIAARAGSRSRSPSRSRSVDAHRLRWGCRETRADSQGLTRETPRARQLSQLGAPWVRRSSAP